MRRQILFRLVTQQNPAATHPKQSKLLKKVKSQDIRTTCRQNHTGGQLTGKLECHSSQSQLTKEREDQPAARTASAALLIRIPSRRKWLEVVFREMQTPQMCILKAAVIQKKKKNGLLKCVCDITSVVFGSFDLWFQCSKICLQLDHIEAYLVPLSRPKDRANIRREQPAAATPGILTCLMCYVCQTAVMGVVFFRLTYWSSCVQVIGILQVRSELCEKPDKMFTFVQQLKTAYKRWRNGVF